MKAAFATWNDRIAPVFDVVHQVHIVEVEAGDVIGETSESLFDDAPGQKAFHLARLGIEVLVCGAISRAMETMVAGHGIRVIPFVAGDLREIIRAWLRGELDGERFIMPGCCGRGRRRFGGVCRIDREERSMNRGRRDGMGSPRGGQGRGGKGQGRMGGPSAAGPSGYCVCPQCGHQQTHERGIPCTQKQCPNCGATMTRQ